MHTPANPAPTPEHLLPETRLQRMDVRFHHDPGRDFLSVVYVGELTVEGIVEVRRRRREMGIAGTVGCALLDLRRVVVGTTKTECETYERSTPVEDLPARRMALVVSEPRITAFALMWAKLVADRAQAQVFSTVEAAYEWLGIEPHEEDPVS